MKKVKLAVEPTVKAPTWIVKILSGKTSTITGCFTKKDAAAEMAKAPVGSRIQIFKAVYNFKEAWKK